MTDYNIKLTRKTVSLHFRTLVIEHYPGIQKNLAYWGLFEYLLFGTRFDEKTGRLLISQETLAKIEGKEEELKSQHYKGQDFLEAFQADVMTEETFQWSGWRIEEKLCRVVSKCEFSYEFSLILLQEQQKEWHKTTGRVYFRTGTKFSKAKQAKEREELRIESLSFLEKARCPEAKILLQYLNELPPNLFNKILTNLDAARNLTYEIYSKPEDENTRRITLNILDSIEDQAKPYYQPSGKGKTVRVYPYNESILLLPRPIREELVKDWTSFDLRSSQLAICAYTWDVRTVKTFLDSGTSIWKVLFHHLGKEYSLKESDKNLYENIKEPIKRALYSVIFGMEKSNVSRNLTIALKPFGIQFGGALFCRHPVIESLFIARENQLKKIRKEGGAIDCFGNKLSISKECSEKSILAQLAQAIELKLLFPVVELAVANPDDFKITLWLHDGFKVAFLDSSKLSTWMKKIQTAVQNKAVELGIPTYLEVS